MGCTTSRSDGDAPGPGLVPLPGRDLADDEVELGNVTGVFSFRGEVKVHLHNPESALLQRSRPVVLIAPDGARWRATVSTRPGAGQRILASVAGVTDDAGAARLKGYRLAIPKAELPNLEDSDEYYVWQLEGAEVRIDGQPVGRVTRVQQAGPHDVGDHHPRRGVVRAGGAGVRRGDRRRRSGGSPGARRAGRALRFDVLTLHPELVRGPLTGSVLGRGIASGVLDIRIHDIREHGIGRHRTVDDTPYGGGAGMVLRVDVVAAAIEAVRTPEARVVLMSAAGQRFDQACARRLASLPQVVLVCGHYEGIDARIEVLVDEELSLGDFVLTGGEIAAVAVVDAAARLIPGVLGNQASPLDESFSAGLLEYPQYTRPREFRGACVPEILLSGHHARIEAWRRAEAERRTRERRPDLWAAWASERPVSPVDGAGEPD